MIAGSSVSSGKRSVVVSSVVPHRPIIKNINYGAVF
jgi:hypothetical protein